MKSLRVLLSVLAILLFTGFAEVKYDAKTAWETLYPQVLKQIVAPEFKEVNYNISDYGAIAGIPEFLNHKLINSTIEL